MAKPNFQFAKRQRELDKKKKKEEKLQRKIEKAKPFEDADGEELPTEKSDD